MLITTTGNNEGQLSSDLDIDMVSSDEAESEKSDATGSELNSEFDCSAATVPVPPPTTTKPKIGSTRNLRLFINIAFSLLVHSPTNIPHLLSDLGKH